jgi:hypothetical protein
VLGLFEEVDEVVLVEPVVAARRSRSKSRPITDAVESTLVASSPRRARRDPMTARTLWGRANCPRCRRPSSARCRPGRSSRLGQVAQHLGHEERVAVGLAVDLVGQSHPGVVEPVPGGRLHEGDDPGVFESLQMQRRDAGLPQQPPRASVSGMRGRELGVAVGAEDDQTGRRCVGHDVAQQLQARLVDPVQVVEHEEHGSLGAGQLEEAHGGGIEEVALGVGVGALGRGDPPGAVGGRAPGGRARPHGRRRGNGATTPRRGPRSG